VKRLVILLLVAASGLRAQQPQSDSVRRADSIAAAKHKLATVVVTGTRLSDVDERTPSQVEPIDVRKATPGPDVVMNALLDLPGISLYDDQGARLQPELEVRGFTVSPIVGTPQGVSVFLDGMRLNEPDAQEVNFDLLPSAAIERASLVRGSNVLFGRNSLGGTLLLDTKRGGNTPEATATLGAGSFGEQTATITAGGKVSGVDGFVAATGSNETGWRQATAANTRNIFATIGHQWGPTRDSGDVSLSFLYAKDRIQEAGSLPVGYAPTINYTPGDFFEPEAYDLITRATTPLGGGVLRATLFGRRNNYEQFNINVPPPSTDSYIYMLSGGGTVEWTRPVAIGPVPIGFTVGAEYERDNVHFRLLNTGGGQPDSITTLSDVHQENAALYGQAIVSVTSSLDVTIGLRDDYIRIPYRDDLVSANNGTSTYNRVSPEIGATYQFTDDVKAFVAFKSGFRAPAPLELACASASAPCSLPSALGADPALKAVSTRDYEGGVDIDLPHKSSLDIDGFWTDVLDDIQFASPDLTHVYFLNVPETRRAGVEVTAKIPLVGGARIETSYSYMAATFQSTVQISSSDTTPRPARPGDIFPNSPLHRGRIALGIGRLIGPVLLDGDIDLRGYSGQYLRGDESNQRPQIPGYTVSDLDLALTFRRYTVSLVIDNLLDRSYSTFGIEAPNTVGGGPNPPVVSFLTPGYTRRFTVSASVRL
jgi:outer membrane receptor protein involved in Fe transport